MAKSKHREYVWLECTEDGQRNYRTSVRTQATGGGKAPKLNLKKFCPTCRKHTEHKMRKK